MRISDWSSDVCSSDLAGNEQAALQRAEVVQARDDFLAGVAALVEADTAEQVEIRHLRDEMIAGFRQHDGNATFDIGASPVRTFVIAQRVVERRAQSRDPLARTDHAVARDAAETEHDPQATWIRSEEHTSELQSLMRISYAVFCL